MGRAKKKVTSPLSATISSTESTNISLPTTTKDITSPTEVALPSLPSLPDGADRIGSISQKEIAAYKQGLTRESYIKVINDLLNAGSIRRDWDAMTKTWTETFVPDNDKRAKGAELAGKFFGDYKERVDSVAVTHNKVVYQWLLQPLPTSRAVVDE